MHMVRKIWTLVSSVIWSIFYCFLLVLSHLSLSKSIIGSRDSPIPIQFSPLFAPMDKDHMTLHLQSATKRETTTNKDAIISSHCKSNEINICRLHMIWKQHHSNELADLTSLCSCERAQSLKNKLSKSKKALKNKKLKKKSKTLKKLYVSLISSLLIQMNTILINAHSQNTVSL